MAFEARVLFSVAVLVMSCVSLGEPYAIIMGFKNPGDQLVVDENIRQRAIDKGTVLFASRNWSVQGMTRFEVTELPFPAGEQPARVSIDCKNNCTNSLEVSFQSVRDCGIYYNVKIYKK